MNIAIIGAGEVGRTYAKAVAEQSMHTAILCDPYPNDKTLRFASEAGLELHRQAGPWLTDTDRVWLCVTGDLALPACRGILSPLRPATVIVDLTTAAPGDKQTASHLAAEHHIQYVEHCHPRRDRAHRGGHSAPHGRASRRGSNARFRRPRRAHPRTPASQPPRCRGARWHEVQRAEAQLTSLGLPATMLSASQEVFARTTRSAAQNPPPDVATTDVNAALKWLGSTIARA